MRRARRAQCLKSSDFTIDSFGVATPQDFALANISGPYTWFNATQYQMQAPKCATKTPQCAPDLPDLLTVDAFLLVTTKFTIMR